MDFFDQKEIEAQCRWKWPPGLYSIHTKSAQFGRI